MISPEQINQLVAMRLQQAEESIADAEFCLANARNGLAANRIYYGMFYAILALGLLRGFESSKHLQIIGWFNKNFVHTGIFPARFNRLVKDAFDARTDADYKINEVPSSDDLQVKLADMKLFIATIKAWLEANPA